MGERKGFLLHSPLSATKITLSEPGRGAHNQGLPSSCTRVGVRASWPCATPVSGVLGSCLTVPQIFVQEDLEVLPGLAVGSTTPFACADGRGGKAPSHGYTMAGCFRSQACEIYAPSPPPPPPLPLSTCLFG